MEPIFVIKLNRKERNFLYELIEDKHIDYRAKIIILSYDGYEVREIARRLDLHSSIVRK